MLGNRQIIAMVLRQVDVDLRLGDFQPRPMLVARRIPAQSEFAR